MMENTGFRFKEFTIQHDRCAMKVGTDGVLLGAWSNVAQASRILDIGTGTGLVALMVAQRSNASIVALDIDKDAVEQAKVNVENSPWKDRIVVMEQDFNTFAPKETFDLIVSNPPYFVDSLTCPEKQRTLARHNNTLGYDELLGGVAKLLSDDGRFCLIVPVDVSESIKAKAALLGLFVQKQLDVITAPGKLPKRILIEFAFHDTEQIEWLELLIEEKRHQYSLEYIALTRDYYLKM